MNELETLQSEVIRLSNLIEWHENFEEYIEAEHRDVYFKASKYAEENARKVRVVFLNYQTT